MIIIVSLFILNQDQIAIAQQQQQQPSFNEKYTSSWQFWFCKISTFNI